jgi:hypothetical protein
MALAVSLPSTLQIMIHEAVGKFFILCEPRDHLRDKGCYACVCFDFPLIVFLEAGCGGDHPHIQKPSSIKLRLQTRQRSSKSKSSKKGEL